MYLPRIAFSPSDFPYRVHACERPMTPLFSGLHNVHLDEIPGTMHVLGCISDEHYAQFLEMCDGFGFDKHHSATCYGVHVPAVGASIGISRVICGYDGRFGFGFAVFERIADGFASVTYYTLHDASENAVFRFPCKR